MEAVAFFALALVVSALILMMDTVRSVRCKECPHCKALVEKDLRERAWSAHKAYHTYTTNVPGCEFCDVRSNTNKEGGN